jgi:NAD+-dependent secondary alcohol dehydrogenase Adh1
MNLAARGKVKLSTKVYSLEEALTALDDLDGGRVPGGRAVLVS